MTIGIRAVNPRIGGIGPILNHDGSINKKATFDLALAILADIKSSMRSLEHNFKVAKTELRELATRQAEIQVLNQKLGSEIKELCSSPELVKSGTVDMIAAATIEPKLDQEVIAKEKDHVFDEMTEPNQNVLVTIDTTRAHINEAELHSYVIDAPNQSLSSKESPKKVAHEVFDEKLKPQKMECISSYNVSMQPYIVGVQGIDYDFDPGGDECGKLRAHPRVSATNVSTMRGMGMCFDPGGGAFASMQPSAVEIVVVVDFVGDMKNVAGVYGNTPDAKFHQQSEERVPAMQLFQVFDEMPVKEMKEQEFDSPNFSDLDLFFELHEYHFRVRDPKVSSQLIPNSFLLQSIEAALVFNRFLHGRAHAQWREEPPGHENSVGSDWLIVDMQLLFHFEAQALDVAEKINKKCGPMVVRFEVLEMSISLSPWEKVDVYPCIGILKVLSKITSISRASKLRNFVKVRLLLLPFLCECYEHDQLLQIELHWVGWYIGQFVVHDFLRADMLESLTEFYNLFSEDLLMRNDNASIDLIIYIKDGCVGLALRLLHYMDSLEIQKNKLIFGEICDSCMRVGSNVPTSVALTCLVYKSMKTILHNSDTECGVHFWLTSRTPLIAPYGLMKIVSTFFRYL